MKPFIIFNQDLNSENTGVYSKPISIVLGAFLIHCSTLQLISPAIAQRANSSVIGCWTTSYTHRLGPTTQTLRINANNTWTIESRTLLSPPVGGLEVLNSKSYGNWYFQANQLVIRENAAPGTVKLDNVFIQTSPTTLQSRDGLVHRRC
jgi:hypothetical protein